MYQYNDANATNYEYTPNDPLQQNQAVPNVLFDDTKNIPTVQIQEGGNMDDINGTQHTIPMYAVDISVPQFEIPDPLLRRNFVRKVLIILLLQNIIILPIIEIFILCTDKPIHSGVSGALGILLLCLFTAMYFFSDIRRYSPMNMIALIVVTILMSVQDAVFATKIDSKIVFLSQLIIIAQILTLLLYTKQNRIKFTNINAIFFILVVFIMCACLVAIISPMLVHSITPQAAFNTMYFVYDIHLMLSGHHGYNLQPEEHIFAATNIYADMPNLLWRILKFFIITPVVTIYRFFVTCCSAEVC